MKNINRYIFVISLIFLCICTKSCNNHIATSKIIQEKDTWLENLEDKNKIILNRDQIASFNNSVYYKGYLVHPLFEGDIVSGNSIKKYLRNDIDKIKKYYLYDINNNRIRSSQIIPDFMNALNFDNILRRIKIKFGLVLCPTELKMFPVDMILLKKPDDYPFDILHITHLDTGEEIVLYHTSKDKKWGFIQSAYSRGWVKLKDIGLTSDRKIIEEYINQEEFVISLELNISIFKNRFMLNRYTTLQMGRKLSLIKKTKLFYEVKVPRSDRFGNLIFKKGFIRNNSRISCQYLSLTQQNIADQTFKMINVPYVWKKLASGVDCSSFIFHIFLSLGLQLPKNSLLQIKTLNKINFNKNNKNVIFSKLEPFTTLLYYAEPDHIMMYLGKYKNKFYVIHSKWAYKLNNYDSIKVRKVHIIDLDQIDDGKNGDSTIFNRISRTSSLK